MSGTPPTGASAGSRRFWITLFIFALLNVGAWIGYHRWRESQVPPPLRKDIVAVESFQPELGWETPDQVRPTTLTWTFNLDMAEVSTDAPATAPATTASAPLALPPGPAATQMAVKGTAASVIPGKIEPAIEGDWLWRTPRTLVFVAKQALPLATTYKATLLPERLRSRDGYLLSKADERTFSTASLNLLNARQVAFDDQDRLILELEFNDAVIPSEAAKHLELLDPLGRKLPYDLLGQATSRFVRVQTAAIPLPDRERNSLRATLRPGLAGTSGPLGITQPLEAAIPISHVLQATQLIAYQPSQGTGNLTLRFNNNAPTVQALLPLLTIDPPVKFNLSGSGGGQVLLTGDFQPATRYTLRIADIRTLEPASRPDDDGEANASQAPKSLWTKYPRPTTLSAFLPDRAPSVAWEHGTRDASYLGSKGNRLLRAKAVNLPAVRVHIQRIYENNLVQWRNRVERDRWSSASDFAKPVGSKRFSLENKKNTPQDITLSVDELLTDTGLSAEDGAYVLSVKPDYGTTDDETPNYYSYGADDTMVISLSDIGLTTKLMPVSPDGKPGQALLTWAVSLSTGKPLQNVKITLYSDKSQPLGTALTDADGLARIDRILPNRDESPVLLTAHAKDAPNTLTWLDLNRSRNNTSDFRIYGQPYLREGYEAFLWTDRGIYRPGETVILRALVRGPQLTVPGELPLRWQIKRPNGQDWRSEKALTNKDGACEWRITIPDDVVTGTWSATLGLPGEAASGSAGMRNFGRVSFGIEEFVPDRIKASIQLAGPGLKPEDPKTPIRLNAAEGDLSVHVQGDYLFGQPAANLATSVDISMAPTHFTPPGFEGYIFHDDAQVSAVRLVPLHTQYQRIDTLQSRLNDSGSAVVDAELPLAEKLEKATRYVYKGPWQLAVVNNVYEAGGRSITSVATVDADVLPGYVGLKGDSYVHFGKNHTVDIACVTTAGKPDDSVELATVTVYRETWNTVVTHVDGRYHYQSTRLLEPIQKKSTEVVLTAGRVRYAWKPADTGSYVVEVVTAREQVASLSVYVSDSQESWSDNISRKTPDRLQIQLVSASQAKPDGDDQDTTPVFKPGEKIRAIIRSPFTGRLLLTLETDTVLSTQTLELTSNSTEAIIELPANIRPNGYIAATVIRPIDPQLEWRTHRAYGIANFAIDSTAHGIL